MSTETVNKESFIKWAMKSPEKQFFYDSNSNCMMAQFLKEEMGWEYPIMGSCTAYELESNVRQVMPYWWADHQSEISQMTTFGEVVRYIEKIN